MGDGFEENIWANKEISKEIMEKKIKMIIFIQFRYIKADETKNWAKMKADVKMDIVKLKSEGAEESGSFKELCAQNVSVALPINSDHLLRFSPIGGCCNTLNCSRGPCKHVGY